MNIRQTVALATMASMAGGALAVPLHYDEAVSGDLIDSPITSLSLDLGLNTIKGSLTSIVGPQGVAGNVDFDPFALALPSGLRLTSISVTTQFGDGSVQGAAANTQAMAWSWSAVVQMPDLSQPPVFGTCYAAVAGSAPLSFCPTLSPTGGALFAGLPSNGSNYIVSQGSFTQPVDWAQAAGGRLDYTVSVNVTAVPEPASWALMAAGLMACLGATGRLRRQQAGRG